MAPMARPSLTSRSRDMFISMAVLMVPIVLIIWFFTNNPDAEVEAVDVAPHLQVAEAEAPYPVLRAENLPEPWMPYRVQWTKKGERWIDGEAAVGNTWMLGYLGPDKIYYGIEQRDEQGAQMIARLTREGKATGETLEAAGGTWERYESADGRTRSLVRRDGEVVSVVYADASFEALDAFATSLTTN